MAAVMNAWQIIALQGLLGFAIGGLLPSTNAIVAPTPRLRRGAIFGFTASAGSLGAFAGPLVGAGLAAASASSFAFAVLGIIMTVSVVIILWYYLQGRIPNRDRRGVRRPSPESP